MSEGTGHVSHPKSDRLVARLVRLQGRLPPKVGWRLYMLMVLRGTDIPPVVKIGPGVMFQHGAIGVVVHPRTTIGRDVLIYHGVTIGRADVFREERDPISVTIEDNAVLCAGCVIVSRGGHLTIGKGAVIGANAVVTQSVGPREIWAGNPARKVGLR